MKGEVSPLPIRYSKAEANLYHHLGCITLQENTEESDRMALEHFHMSGIVSAIGDDEGAATAKSSIAIAKSVCDDGSSDELLKTSRELYELRVAQSGEDHELTIDANKEYAISRRWSYL